MQQFNVSRNAPRAQWNGHRRRGCGAGARGRKENSTGIGGRQPNEQEITEASVDNSPVRIGSPFAADPIAFHGDHPIEAVYDVGPLRYTAMGAVAAALMVVGFAAAAAWWFPSGGTLIAALGCALSIFGMYSTFRLTSVGLLVVHLSLFVLSYTRSIG